eukprot:7430769-Ditylum_brightwellii.AAC.1
MKSIFAILSLLLVCLTASTSAFAPSGRTTALMPRTSVAPATTTSLNVFGKKKTAEQKAIEEEKAAKFWQGEWVCKDCGYIYQR